MQQTIARKYIAFDIETTGLYPQRGDRIIEIGAVSMQGGVIESEFHIMVNVQRRISKTAHRIHGITNGDLRMRQCRNKYFQSFRFS